MPETQMLLDRAAQAVELCKAAGADDCVAAASRSRSVEFTTRNGTLEKVQESTSRSLELRIYVEGRYSAHSTTDLRPEMLQSFIADAVTLTRALQPDPFRVIPDPKLYENRPQVDLELLDEGLAALTQARREELCKAMDAAAGAHEKAISASSTVQDGHAMLAAVSSNGFSGTAAEGDVWMVSEVTLKDEGDRRPEAWDYMGARHLSELADPALIGGGALQRAIARLGAGKGPTGKHTLVIEPRSAGRLLSSLLGPASARDIQQGHSFWKGRLGQALASDKLTVIDDPLLVGGFASRLFDNEGISSRRLPLIEAGIAKNVYVDTYYGKKADMEPTTGSPSNKVVALGDKGLAALMAEVGEGILVTGWLGGNSDPTTGDFSFGMEGHLIEGGMRAACVGEMVATGNLMDLFKALVAVGNDPWRYSSTLAPTLVFEGVQISGG
ncbi:MAG: TldD/PmbA family protein [Pseudomonadota bacterium]